MRRRRPTLPGFAFSAAVALLGCIGVLRGQDLPAPSIGAISGVVRDGTTGHPIGGAVVTLFGGRGAASSQTSDADGRFIFIRLASDRSYQLAVAKPGYARMLFGRRVPLREREWVRNVDLALSPLGAITGRVTTESGDPAVGIFVRARVKVFVGSSEKWIGGPISQTDDRGVYRIAGVDAGEYLVEIPSTQWSAPATSDAALLPSRGEPSPGNSAGVSPMPQVIIRGQHVRFVSASSLAASSANSDRSYPTWFYPSARWVRDAVPITLGTGESRSNVDIVLGTVPVVDVSGVVDAPPDADVGGMVLRLLPEDSPDLSNGGEIATTVVASTGEFLFLGVPAGTYTLVASRALFDLQVGGGQPLSRTGSTSLPVPPGFGTGMSGGAALPSGLEYRYGMQKGAPEYAGRMEIAVGAGPVSGVVLRLQRGVTIAGRVVVENSSVSRAETVPRTGELPVIAEPADGEFLFGLPAGRLVAKGATGTFTIAGVQPGRYLLHFPALGVLGGAAIKSVMWDGRDYAVHGLDVQEGRDIGDVVVTVSAKAPLLTGIVRDARGRPVSAAHVMVFPVSPADWKSAGLSSSTMQTVDVDHNGEFIATLGRAGEYYAVAVGSASGRNWRDPRWLKNASLVATRVSVAWTTDQRIDLTVANVQGIR